MSVLSKPYPKDSTILQKVFIGFLYGNFVFLFLFLFQPFGLNEWKVEYKELRLAGYGLITMLVLLFNSILVERSFLGFFGEKNWKVWKEILWSSWNIVLIGACNLLYSYWQIGFPLTFAGFLTYQWITLLIGLFPVTIATLISYNRLQSKMIRESKELNEIIGYDMDVEEGPVNPAVKNIEIVGENANERVVLNPEDLIYIESTGNYITISWLDNERLNQKMIRSTLKQVETLFTGQDYIFKTHRSYLVNLKKVIKVSGNSQGYKLHFLLPDDLVPVSRSLNEIIREKIGEIHAVKA